MSYSTLLEICKVGLGGRIGRKEMKGFVSLHINLLYNIKINSFPYRNDNFFLYNSYRREIILILYNKLI